MTDFRLGVGFRLRRVLYQISLIEFGVAIDAGRAIGHPANRFRVNPLFNGRRDREIAETLAAAQTGTGYTITGDGLPGDPVNVALVGTLGNFDRPL